MSGAAALDGFLLRELLRGGHLNLSGNAEYLNDINVFPVSDADTGTNLSRTMGAGLSETVRDARFSVALASFAKGALYGSRGNSGSILSQYFVGLTERTAGLAAADPARLADAMGHAWRVAHRAVLEPAEGTILTAMRETAARAAGYAPECASIDRFFDRFAADALEIARGTQSQMALLRESGVSDSGAVGFYFIVEGMRNALRSAGAAPSGRPVFDFGRVGARAAEVRFRYCVEFLLRPDEDRPRERYVELLEGKGDSLIVSAVEGAVKAHIHTDEPQYVLSLARTMGELAETKIEDQRLQQEINLSRAAPRKHDGYALLAFAHGDGIIRLFEELGCDRVLTATQNYHVREEGLRDLLGRFSDTAAILFPSDDGIYRTAAALFPRDRFPNVRIADSRNVMRTYFALSLIVGTDPLARVLESIEEAESLPCLCAKILSVSIQSVRYYVGFKEGGTIMDRDLPALLAALLPTEVMGGYRAYAAFRGQTARGEDDSALERFFEGRGVEEFALLAGLQDDFDYIIGAI